MTRRNRNGVRSQRELAFALREHLQRAGLFVRPFFAGELDLTVEQEKKVERYMADHFQIWAESWIWPIAQELAQRAGIPNEDFELGDTIAAAVRDGRDWR